MRVDRGDGKNSVLSDIGVTVFETRTRGGEERLDQLGFAELGEVPQGISTNIFVRMLKIIPNAVAIGKQC